MYSVYEKLLELCPVIKELLVDEGMLGQKGPKAGDFEQQNQVMNEMLARLINL